MPSIAMTGAVDQHPLVASQLPAWYPRLERHSFKSIVIPLPPGFLEYLQEDGIFLADDSAAVPALDRIDAALLVEGDYRRDDWEDESAPAAPPPPRPDPQPSPSGPLHSGHLSHPSSTTTSASAEQQQPRRVSSTSTSSTEATPTAANADWSARFPALRTAIDTAICQLGGRVVPKLNWSA
ncbi:hypothetical protein Agub_g9023, partial [Astrephomene gubernaculifera]